MSLGPVPSLPHRVLTAPPRPGQAAQPGARPRFERPEDPFFAEPEHPAARFLVGNTENKLRQLKIDGVWLATAVWPALHNAGPAAAKAATAATKTAVPASGALVVLRGAGRLVGGAVAVVERINPLFVSLLLLQDLHAASRVLADPAAGPERRTAARAMVACSAVGAAASLMASGWLGAWALAPGLPVLGGVAMAAFIGSLLAARRARA